MKKKNFFFFAFFKKREKIILQVHHECSMCFSFEISAVGVIDFIFII